MDLSEIGDGNLEKILSVGCKILRALLAKAVSFVWRVEKNNLLLVCLCVMSFDVISGNWVGKPSVVHRDNTFQIPEKYRPNLEELRKSYIGYSRADLYKHSKFTVPASKTPTKLMTQAVSNEFVQRQMESTGLLSYLLFKDNVLVIDEISPEDRLGDLINLDTQFNSFSVGKSLVGYMTGFALCNGILASVDQPLADWPLVRGTFYEHLKLIDILNMSAGDQRYFNSSESLIGIDGKYQANVNNVSISKWMYLLKGKKPSRKVFNYSELSSNLVHNYIAFHAGDKYQALLNKFGQKLGIKTDLNFISQGQDLAVGPLRTNFFATRYDYLRIGLSMIEDWQENTCEGKFLKALYERRVRGLPKNKQDHLATWESYSYAGFFHTDIKGIQGKVFGMDGYGGQHLFVNFDTGSVVVTHAIHEDYNWRRIVFGAISSKPWFAKKLPDAEFENRVVVEDDGSTGVKVYNEELVGDKDGCSDPTFAALLGDKCR